MRISPECFSTICTRLFPCIHSCFAAMARGPANYAGCRYLSDIYRQHSRAPHQIKVALDPRMKTEYFETIQHGQLAPECNRFVRLTKWTLKRFEVKTYSTVDYLRRVALACSGIALAWTVQAQPHVQKSIAPSGLNWKWMNEAVFDAPRLLPSATAKEQALSQAVWGDKLNVAKARGDPSFVLVASADVGGAVYVFSIFLRAGACENPPNGSAGAEEMYSKCPMRVVLNTNGRSSLQNFFGYCYLNLHDADHPRASFHTEFAIDQRTSTAYFRVIQHGKTVSQCNRSIRLAAK